MINRIKCAINILLGRPTIFGMKIEGNVLVTKKKIYGE